MEKVYLDWVNIEALVKCIALNIKLSKCPPSYISGLPRGGLIPAVMLSHELNIPFIPLSLIESLPTIDILLVDDIADSGETLEAYRKYNTAVLHYKMQSEHIPTYYGMEIPNDAWIVYPWEQKESETIQDYKVK
jgi:hypoxanthine phosphoribosyltransferase